jgi:ubiquinone/menaquinone biosynthesis C-methylase UbiE
MLSRKNLLNLYWKMERVLVPELKYCQHVYEEVLNGVVKTDIKWLDLGCGHQVLPAWRFEQEKRLIAKAGTVVGIDADFPSVDKHRSVRLRFVGNISALPFRDSSFDLITANMVVEHLDNPLLQFQEVSRVLKPGGMFVFHTPHARGYSTMLARLLPEGLKLALIRVLQGRPSEDVFRTFYRANTEADIQRLAHAAGFEPVEVRLIASSAELAILAPLAFLELLWIRLSLTRAFRRLRTNFIVVLAKSGLAKQP